MKSIFFYICILSTTVLTSCDSKQKELDEITSLAVEMDSIMRETPVLMPEQRAQADLLMDKYKEFVAKYPEDSLAPLYLMKASFVAGAMPEIDKQIELLEEVAAKYPQSEYASQALALAAKSYADNKKDYESARECLRKLQSDYPESPYSVNIDLQIEYVGDDDGLFRATMRRKAEMDSINAVKQGPGQ